MELPVDPVEQPAFPSLAENIKKYEEDPEEAQNMVKWNRDLVRLLIMNYSLWLRNDSAIAWDLCRLWYGRKVRMVTFWSRGTRLSRTGPDTFREDW
jgi:hypothetical protein